MKCIIYEKKKTSHISSPCYINGLSAVSVLPSTQVSLIRPLV
jgi:hypothetical protein